MPPRSIASKPSRVRSAGSEIFRRPGRHTSLGRCAEDSRHDARTPMISREVIRADRQKDRYAAQGERRRKLGGWARTRLARADERLGNNEVGDVEEEGHYDVERSVEGPSVTCSTGQHSPDSVIHPVEPRADCERKEA